MKFRFTLLVITLLFFMSGFSQEMKKGFNYLETGKFKEAAQFFKVVLKEYPDNKTAKLCYGRAIGLSGNPQEANKIFVDLLETYPKDFEIKLNYAESLLWNNNFKDAESYYKKLISENDKSFPALLGYANTLSNLKKYEEALVYVNKALEVSVGNENALVSKKYINLGYANQFVNQNKYDEALAILNENLTLFKNDKETLLNLANVYLIAEDYQGAEETYELMTKNPELKFNALNGFALAAHLQEDDKKALEISTKTLQLIDENTSESSKKSTIERYIQALIWNRKFKDAQLEINKLIKEYPNENWVLGLRATLNTYKSDFKKSLEDYDLILKNDIKSFDGNLGKANAQKALGLYEKAYSSAYNTLSFYKNQKDALNFIAQLDQQFVPQATAKTTYSFDNGNNQANNYMASLILPISLKFAVLADGNYRTTDNENTNAEARSTNFNLGLSYQLLPNVIFKGTGGVIQTTSAQTNYSQFITNLSFNIKPYKLQNLELGYQRRIEDFNADLLNSELIQNNFFLNYNLNTNFNLGWFTQYYYTTQNDNNTRNLLFTSLYYSILNKPVLKTGINYQYITFKDQVPLVYFSPEQFNVIEIFVDFLKTEQSIKNKGFYYGLNGAVGLQTIDNGESQNTFRIKANLGYKFSTKATLDFYGAHSNIASATAAGFQFTEFGLLFKYSLFKNPIFRK